jgi:hypothetical protein
MKMAAIFRVRKLVVLYTRKINSFKNNRYAYHDPAWTVM